MAYYSDLTLKLLFAGAANQCSFPGCTVQAVDTKLKRSLCEICHIKGENPGSARYDASQSPAERNDYANLIVLCSLHHRAVVDLYPETYTAEKLLTMKEEHEAAQHAHVSPQQRDVELLRQLLDEQRDPHLPDEVLLDNARAHVRQIPTDQVPPPSPLPAGSRVPFRHNPLFLGRDPELLALAHALKGERGTNVGPNVIAVATGAGGMGKTQIVSEFVHRFGQFFGGGVFWIDFERTDAVANRIAECATSPLVAPYLPNDVSEYAASNQAALVRSAWEGGPASLLIFDNCETEELLNSWLPVTGQCRVIVTSRRAEWDPAFGLEHVEVRELSRPHSIELLSRFTRDVRQDDPDLDRLADLLGDLPLALHVAGSYLRRHGRMNLSHYLSQITSSEVIQHPSLQAGGTSPTGHDLDVGRTFVVSYRQLNGHDPTDDLALQILHAVSYAAPGLPAPVQAIFQVLDIGHDASEVQAEDAVNRLVDLGLVEREAPTCIRVHGLIASFARQSDNTGSGLSVMLESPMPIITREAEAVARPIARYAPDVVGRAVRDLQRSPQPWTRTAALRLALACGDEYVDIEAVVDRLRDDAGKRGAPGGVVWPRRSAFINPAEQVFTRDCSAFLIRHRRDDVAVGLVEDVYRHGQFSMAGREAFRQLVHGEPIYGNMAGRVDTEASAQREAEIRIDWLLPTEDDIAAERGFLQLVTEVASELDASEAAGVDNVFEALRAFIGAMACGEEEFRNSRLWAQPPDEEAVREVVRGMILALSISPADLSADARRALEQPDDVPWHNLFGSGTTTESVNWARASGAGLNAEELVRALSNPLEAVARTAAMLLSSGAGGDEVSMRLETVLRESKDEDVLYLVGMIASTVWQGAALDHILARTESDVTPATSHLFGALAEVEGGRADPRSLDLLVNSLSHERASVATRAAEILADGGFAGLSDRLEQIRRALGIWRERGTECEEHGGPIHAASCPSCHLVLPDPCAPLTRILADNHGLTFAHAYELCSFPRAAVRQPAVTALLQLVADDPTFAAQALRGVASGDLPGEVLDGVLSMPEDSLAAVSPLLLGLLRTGRAEVRARILRALPGAKWLAQDKAVGMGEATLNDKDPHLRNVAVETLRALSGTREADSA